MNILKIVAATTALTAFAATAQAQDSNLYINAGVDAVEFDAYTLTGKLGYNFNDYFGVEGQASFGISDDEESFSEIVEGSTITGDVSAGIDNSFAGYARVKFPVSDRVEVFARGGYHFTQYGFESSDFSINTAGTLATINGTEDNIDADGFTAGAGAQFMMNELNGIRIEYTYFDLGEIEGITVEDTDFGEVGSDVYSISYVRKF